MTRQPPHRGTGSGERRAGNRPPVRVDVDAGEGIIDLASWARRYVALVAEAEGLSIARGARPRIQLPEAS